ncbi:unnamed protein product [Meganyctiphanes norvegica]|uniref:Uncharacterized protein n=1 Tax=Meganyctiphanes norvegica TaxID=48144 RepID=A0AAV2RNR0_MEGNR
MILFTKMPSTPFKRLQMPLLHGLSAAVVIILILKASPRALISLLLNSLPLSVKIFFGAPKVVIQLVNKPVIIVEGHLFCTTVAAQKRVAISINSSLRAKTFEMRENQNKNKISICALLTAQTFAVREIYIKQLRFGGANV